jgi:hypothetical protein
MSRQRNDDREPEQRVAAASLAVRYEPRYAVPIGIEVTGIDRNREAFHERTFTRNVSEWGCAFLLPVELKKDDIISLRVAGADKEEIEPAPQSLFQVVRVTREGNGWLVGTWKMENKDVWGANLEKIDHQEEGTLEPGKEGAAKRVERLRKDKDQ